MSGDFHTYQRRQYEFRNYKHNFHSVPNLNVNRLHEMQCAASIDVDISHFSTSRPSRAACNPENSWQHLNICLAGIQLFSSTSEGIAPTKRSLPVCTPVMLKHMDVSGPKLQLEQRHIMFLSECSLHL